MSTSPIAGSFQIARAYGVQPVARRAPVAQAAAAASTSTTATNLTSRLVAGTVPGRVSFAGDQPAPDTSALAMYRHPADKNAAATAVSAGRLIDVTG
jgi:hypothetical protein